MRFRRSVSLSWPSLLLLAVGCGASGAAPCPPEGAAEEVADPGPPQGFVPATVMGVLPTPQGNALMLRSDAAGRLLPIFIGDAEASVIRMRLAGEEFPRPLTHDLLDRLVDELGGKIVRVLVTKIRGEVFIGTLVVRQGGRLLQIDARPSDAIAIAVGNRTPIFVSTTVLDAAGLPLDDFRP